MAVSTIGTSGIADANITTAKLADATVTTAKLAASSALVGKNLIQNGAMTVAQRGATIVSPTNAITLDRWHAQVVGADPPRAAAAAAGQHGPGLVVEDAANEVPVQSAQGAFVVWTVHQHCHPFRAAGGQEQPHDQDE